VARHTALRGKLGIVVLVAGLAVAAAAWVKARVLVIEPGPGTPMGSTVRTDTHLATLIQRLQPYTPSLHRDPSKDRNTVSVFLVPLDGSAPKLVRLVGDLPPGSYSLARPIGSDGRTMWLSVNGLFGVELRSYALLTADDVRRANPQLDATWTADTRGMDIVDGRLRLLANDRSAAWAIDPATFKAVPVPPRPVNRSLPDPPLTLYQAAGLYSPPRGWLGLHSKADLEGAYAPRRWVRPVESARDAREMRRLARGELEPEKSQTGSQRIVSMAPVGEAEYLNASFLRPNEKSEPLRVPDPDSALMLHTLAASTPTGGGTLAVSRVDTAGRALWTKDTALDRFKLRQILPGERSTVFVGTRAPVPDKVSEPLLVILEHASGRLVTHSLWQ
jgi:hypothetical protein